MKTPKRSPTTSHENTSRKSVHITSSYSPLLPPWRHLSMGQKLKAVMRYAKKQGGFTANLNLSPEFEQRLRSCADPIRVIQKRVNHELNKAGIQGFPLLLMLEVSPEGRLHLHGVSIPGHHPPQALHTAMRKAVGYVKGRSGSRQIKCDPMTNADGWHTYITKAERRTRKYLELPERTRLHWTTRSLTRMTKAHHDEMRHALPANLDHLPCVRAI